MRAQMPPKNSPPAGHIPALDGIRALSILLVMYFHFWQQNWLMPPRLDMGLVVVDFYPLAACGFLGVELLFVLSGFLLYRPISMGQRLHGRRLGEYFAKRFIRIYPCYALCVLVCGAMAFAEFDGVLEWLSYTGRNLLLLNMLSPELLFNRFNSVLWSAAVEVYFYLAFPLLAMLMQKAPRITLLCTAAVCTLYRVWALRFSGDLAFYMNQLPGLLDCFVGGMFTAHAIAGMHERNGEERNGAVYSMVSLGGGALFLFLLFLLYLSRGSFEGIQHHQVVYRPFFILAACLIIGGAARAPRLFQRIVGNPALAWIAGLSYNLYLWHQWLSVKLRIWRFPPYQTIVPQDDPSWQWQHMLLSAALSFAIAAAVTYAFERPIAKALNGAVRRLFAARDEKGIGL